MTNSQNDPIVLNKLYSVYLNSVIKWATKTNPSMKLPATDGKLCNCDVNVSADYKHWTEQDWTTIATSKFGAGTFETVYKLAYKKQVEKDPQAAEVLRQLAPEGMTADQFYNMIVRINTKNFEAVEKANNEGKIYDMDFDVFLLKRDMNITKVDKATILDFKNNKDPEKVLFYVGIYRMVEISQETDTEKNPTEAALHARKTMAQLSKTNDWKTIYNILAEIDNGEQMEDFANKTVKYFKDHKLPKLDKAALANLVKSQKTIPAFELLFLLADHAKDKSNTENEYSTGATAAQNALKALSKDGKWESIQAEIMKIYNAMPKEGKKEDKKVSSVIDINQFTKPDGVALASTENEKASLDPQAAFAKSGVTLQLPSDKLTDEAIAHGLAALQASKTMTQRAA